MAHILLQQILDFHKKFKKMIGDPRYPNVYAERDFRLDLIKEEYKELLDALADPNISERERVIQVADALGDMVYVLFGAAIAWGIDLASVLDAIHESNMTKSLGEKRQDGKVLKGKEYVPPKIEQELELAAYDFNKTGGHETEDEDPWWPVPTAEQGPECFYPTEEVFEDEEPTQELQPVTDKIMLAAKDQAKILAMKDLAKNTADFVPPGCEDMFGQYPSDGTPEAIRGEMTAYGAYVFDCPCGRKHAAQAKLGSRGGLAPNAKAECICGKAFVIDFTKGDPTVRVTTIEELRKQEG